MKTGDGLRLGVGVENGFSLSPVIEALVGCAGVETVGESV